MSVQVDPQTFAAYVTLCVTCGGEVHWLERAENGKSIIRPCGHAANLRLVPNPRLGQRPA